MVNASISGFVEWWVGELQSIARSLGLRAAWRNPKRIDRVHISRSGIELSLTTEKGQVSTACSPHGNDFESFFNAHRLLEKEIEITIDSDWLLTRSLGPLILPHTRAKSIAAIDVLSTTPFDNSEISIFIPKEPRKLGEQRYFVAKRIPLERIFGAIDAQCLNVVSLIITTKVDSIEVVDADWKQLRQRRNPRTLRSRLLFVAHIACVCGAAGTVAHIQYRQGAAAQVLERKLESISDEARVAEAALKERQFRLARIESVRGSKEREIHLGTVWSALTDILSDDTSITDLQFDDKHISLTGTTSSASKLIELLDASPIFSEPEFRGPVVKVIEGEGERFTLDIGIEN